MSFTAKQKEFLDNATHRWNIKSGAVRSGKTYLDYFVIPKRIRAVAGKDGLIVLLGNTKSTLQRNIIEPLQNIWGTQLVSDIKSDNTCYLFGEKAYCLGADKISQVDRIRGTSIKYCYGDEIVTWNEQVFEMLKSRLDKPYSKFDGTCNPDNPFHWFKEFLDKGNADIYLQEYTIFDNEFLPEEVKQNIVQEHTGVFYDRYVLGKWALAEGLIFDYNEDINGYKGENPDGEYYVSIDYGITNPFVAQLWCIEGWHNAKCVDEYYYDSKAHGDRRKTDEEHYAEVKKLIGDTDIEHIVIDPSASSFVETIYRHGDFSVRKADNDVKGGIGNMMSFMKNGWLKWNVETCGHTIKEFGVYRWDDESGQDKPVKENDHGCDASRYFCQSILRRLWR
jgi:PBSX family phage terminase large subunit